MKMPGRRNLLNDFVQTSISHVGCTPESMYESKLEERSRLAGDQLLVGLGDDIICSEGDDPVEVPSA